MKRNNKSSNKSRLSWILSELAHGVDGARGSRQAAFTQSPPTRGARKAFKQAREYFVSFSLTSVTVPVTYGLEPSPDDSDGLRPAGRKSGASAAPARGFATRSRADPGLDILVVPADGRLLIFIRKCRN